MNSGGGGSKDGSSPIKRSRQVVEPPIVLVLQGEEKLEVDRALVKLSPYLANVVGENDDSDSDSEEDEMVQEVSLPMISMKTMAEIIAYLKQYRAGVPEPSFPMPVPSNDLSTFTNKHERKTVAQRADEDNAAWRLRMQALTEAACTLKLEHLMTLGCVAITSRMIGCSKEEGLEALGIPDEPLTEQELERIYAENPQLKAYEDAQNGVGESDPLSHDIPTLADEEGGGGGGGGAAAAGTGE